MNPYDDNWYDGREVTRLEVALQRSTNELHALKRERNTLQSKLTTLLEAAEDYLKHNDGTQYWDGAEANLRAAVKKAREGL